MKCMRLNDQQLLSMMLERELPAYLEEHPNCPPPFAVYEILSRKQKQKTADLAAELNSLPGVDSVYNSNILGKWRRGERTVPREVESYLRAECMRCLLGPIGAKLAELLGEGAQVETAAPHPWD
jgi:hypothetical protein